MCDCSLRDKKWVNDMTRLVVIEALLYNPNVNLFSVCMIAMEMPETSGNNTEYMTVYLHKVQHHMNHLDLNHQAENDFFEEHFF